MNTSERSAEINFKINGTEFRDDVDMVTALAVRKYYLPKMSIEELIKIMNKDDEVDVKIHVGRKNPYIVLPNSYFYHFNFINQGFKCQKTDSSHLPLFMWREFFSGRKDLEIIEESEMNFKFRKVKESGDFCGKKECK